MKNKCGTIGCVKRASIIWFSRDYCSDCIVKLLNTKTTKIEKLNVDLAIDRMAALKEVAIQVDSVEVTKALDEVTAGSQDLINCMAETQAQNKEYQDLCEVLDQASKDMFGSVTKLFQFLGTRAELFEGDVEFNEYMDKLAIFITTPAGIKTMVANNES